MERGRPAEGIMVEMLQMSMGLDRGEEDRGVMDR
jgi:hypothetical protein